MYTTKEDVDNPGFFEIPGFPGYRLDREGRVLNTLTGKLLSGSWNPDGYLNYRIKRDDEHVLTIGRHRLLGLVFKHPGVDTEDLVINHINGIKGDDALDNLEWVTQRENLLHSFETGLCNHWLPFSMRDVDSGVVEKYDSVAEYSRRSGLSKDALLWRLKIGETRVFPERKQYRLGYEEHSWYLPKDVEIEVLKNGHNKPILLKDLTSGQIQEYVNATALCEDLDIPAPTLSTWMRGNNQPVLPGYIQLKWKTDPAPWRLVGDIVQELSEFTKEVPVICFNPETNKGYIFASAMQCSGYMNVKPTTLNERLRSQGLKRFRDGFTYKRYDSSVKSPSTLRDVDDPSLIAGKSFLYLVCEHGNKQMSNLNDRICNNCRKVFSQLYIDRHGHKAVLKTTYCSKSCATTHLRGKTKDELQQLAIDFINSQGKYCTSQDLYKGTNTSSKTFTKHELKASELNVAAGMTKPKSKFQNSVSEVLTKHFEHVEHEKKFDGLVGVKGHPLRVDFYIPEINTVVEADGTQHSDPKHPWKEWSNGTVAEYDRIKDKYFDEKGVRLVRISYKKKIEESDILSRLS